MIRLARKRTSFGRLNDLPTRENMTRVQQQVLLLPQYCCSTGTVLLRRYQGQGTTGNIAFLAVRPGTEPGMW